MQGKGIIPFAKFLLLIPDPRPYVVQLVDLSKEQGAQGHVERVANQREEEVCGGEGVEGVEEGPGLKAATRPADCQPSKYWFKYSPYLHYTLYVSVTDSRETLVSMIEYARYCQ